jgi:hypothetical protein
MRNLANHMLMMTVAIVRLSHTGMNKLGRSDDVLETPVPPLEKRAGKKEAAANPTMIRVRSTSRRGEDLLAAPVPCDAS